jgi:hypothetical protein
MWITLRGYVDKSKKLKKNLKNNLKLEKIDKSQ